jgi:hypothetical protein
MNRLLAVPAIVVALSFATACSGTQMTPGPAAPAPAAPNTPATTPTDAGPTDATPPAAPDDKADDTPPPAAKRTKAAAHTKSVTHTERKGGDATFPISPGTHLVLLHSYSSTKHTAVIEPATFTDDGQSVKGDGSRYTLPVNSSPKVFSTNGGNPDCMDGTGAKTTGSCLTDVAWLRQQLNPGGFPVTIANTGDFIYEIAEQYRP